MLLTDLACGGDAEQVAQRMLDTLHQPLHLGEQTLVVSASIGIATLPAHTAAEQALQAADLALYRAKQAGKAQFARYSQELQAAARRQLELESALGQALERDEFVLHYQPICRIDQGQPRLVGVEALLRWRHAGRLIAPQEFIASLEESGEILRVGDWVEVGGYVDPAQYGALKTRQEVEAERLKRINATTAFAPQQLVSSEDTQSLVVRGRLRTLVNGYETANDLKAYRIDFGHAGARMHVIGFKEVPYAVK